MIKKKNFINLISLAALYSISILFLSKYTPRYSEHTSFILIIFTIIFFVALFLIEAKVADKSKLSGKFNLLSFIIFFVLASVIIFIAPAETRVGRVAAMNTWLQNFQNSIFPYQSEVNPSGFPFLFFLASPFYLLGDVGLFAAFGAALLFLQIKLNAIYKKEFFFVVVVLFLLPSTWYELLTRSDLLTNSALLIGISFLTFKFILPQRRDLQFYTIAVIAGLFAATRMISFLILATLYLFHFRFSLKNGLIFLLIAAVTFVLINLPFLFWNYDYFINSGPFAIQTLYLPSWVYFVFPVFILYFGWAVADQQEYFFFNGVIIFLLVVISFVRTINAEGFHAAFYGSRFDISYFILSVPFFLLALREYDVDRFLGKIYPLEK